MANIGHDGKDVPGTHVVVPASDGNLTRYPRAAREGAPILVSPRDALIAPTLAPSAEIRPARQPGVLRGKIRMNDDFDPLPDDILAAMEA